jgi:hypothetical protein
MKAVEIKSGLSQRFQSWLKKSQMWHRPIRFGLFFIILASLPLAYYLLLGVVPEKYQLFLLGEKSSQDAPRTIVDLRIWPERREINTPEYVKGIYVSAATVGYKSRFDELVSLVDQTELNSMVVDVKDQHGRLAFIPENESLSPHVSSVPELGQLKTFTAPLKDKNIYLIARIFVFQDQAFAEAHPELAVSKLDGGLWRDYRGIPWLDPAAKQVWRYNVLVAREAFAGGFDEVQFDYIRFPSDGNLKTMTFPFWDQQKTRVEVLTGFFAYLDRELRVKNDIPISADLFGMTMWQHDFDLNIGQKLINALPYFDFISPMVYPSHYPPGFNDYTNPATQPYEVIYQNMIRGQRVKARLGSSATAVAAGGDTLPRAANFRPWIQDFDLGAVYTPEMVRAQIIATDDGGGSGWLLWNARNVYTVDALLPADSEQ